MSVHIRTGNRLDVIIEYVEGGNNVLGLQVWGSKEIIPLPDPKGLMEVLRAQVRKKPVRKP